LPNVGKSTLFNALTKGRHRGAEKLSVLPSIGPNVGVVDGPSMSRLAKLDQIAKPQKVIRRSSSSSTSRDLVPVRRKAKGWQISSRQHPRDDAIAHVVRASSMRTSYTSPATIDPVSESRLSIPSWRLPISPR
jgi:ribosome-binding ATPase YchF (GTP1/OBG family)